MVRCHAICYLCRMTIISVDNCLIKWQLRTENFLHTQSIWPMLPFNANCRLIKRERNDVRVPLTNNHILQAVQLFCDAYDKIVFDFRCRMACAVLWTPANTTENLYDNLCTSNSHDWFFWLSNRVYACSPYSHLPSKCRIIVGTGNNTRLYMNEMRWDESTVRMLTEKAYGIHRLALYPVFAFFGRWKKWCSE